MDLFSIGFVFGLGFMFLLVVAFECGPFKPKKAQTKKPQPRPMAFDFMGD